MKRRMSKYYAVKVGKKPGIYRSWPETQAQVVGFSGAIYKSFTSKTEAEEFINGPSHTDEVREKDFEAIAYCDGSAYQGAGGYGYLTIINGQIKKYCGPIPEATNNIAELTAVKRCLHKLRNYERVLIYSDSQYSINTVTGNWDSDVNLELIQEISEILKERPGVKLKWVKGHAGQKYNEMVDQLAKKGRLKNN